MRSTETNEDRMPFLPPCDQAQADGAPCTELGRKCETCEHATAEWRAANKRAQAERDAEQ